jgi:HSP20 family protein
VSKGPSVDLARQSAPRNSVECGTESTSTPIAAFTLFTGLAFASHAGARSAVFLAQKEVIVMADASEASKEQSSRLPISNRGTEPWSASRTVQPYRQSFFSGSSPLSLMRRMMGDMDRLFGAFGNSSILPSLDEQVERSFWAPQIDVFERDNELVVHADLPGLRQEDLRVNVDQGVLTISGQRTQERSDQQQQGGMRYSERSFGSFQRSIALPEGTDMGQIRASFDNGVLEVTAPIPEQARSKGRDIPIGPKASSEAKH